MTAVDLNRVLLLSENFHTNLIRELFPQHHTNNTTYMYMYMDDAQPIIRDLAQTLLGSPAP